MYIVQPIWICLLYPVDGYPIDIITLSDHYWSAYQSLILIEVPARAAGLQSFIFRSEKHLPNRDRSCRVRRPVTVHASRQQRLKTLISAQHLKSM